MKAFSSLTVVMGDTVCYGPQMTKASQHKGIKLWVMCLCIVDIVDIDIVSKCLVFPECNFVFKQKLSPVNRDLSICNFFKSKNIQVLDSQGNPPDVNQIEK